MHTERLSVRVAGGAALVCAALLMPLAGRHIMFVMILTCINILLASSMQVSLTVGLWNFGVVGFMAIGAYTSGLLTSGLGVPFAFAFIGAGAAAAIVGFLLGLPALRLRGVYFLLLTVGFTEVVRSAAIKWLPSHIYAPAMSLGGHTLGRLAQYYLVTLITTLVLILLYRLNRSRTGLTFKGISQAENLAAGIGINTYRFRIVNFVVSCSVAGLAGSMFAHTVTLVTPWGFSFTFMMYIAIWNFAGGIRYFSGPIIGAIVLTLMIEPLSSLAHYESIAYAAIIIVMVFFLPDGLVTLPRRVRNLGVYAWTEMGK